MSGSSVAGRTRRWSVRRALSALRTSTPARAPWAVLATALSSVGNLLLTLTVARLASIDDLGRFALAFSLYILATGLSRAVVTEAVLTAATRVTVAAGGRRVAAVGCGCAVPLGAAGLADASGYLLITAVALPGLLLHDYAKAIGVGVGRARTPCHREAVWTALTALAAVAGLVGVLSPVAVFAGWAGSGALLGYATALLRGRPVRPGWRLDRAGNRAATSFGLQFLLTTGSAQLALTLLAATAGTAVVGALSAGRTVVGPAALLVGSATTLVIPYLARSRSASPRAGQRAAVRAAALLMAATAPACVLVVVLPDRVGAALLGDNWRHAEPLLALLALEVLFSGAAMVGFAGHRVRGAARRALLLGGSLGVLRVPVVVAGAGVGGARGAAAALAVMALVSTLAWWASYLLLPTGPADAPASPVEETAPVTAAR